MKIYIHTHLYKYDVFSYGLEKNNAKNSYFVKALFFFFLFIHFLFTNTVLNNRNHLKSKKKCQIKGILI